MLRVESFTLYHSPNAYLGMVRARERLAGLPVQLERRPICVPRARGLKIADLVGGGEAPRQSAYHREDCERFARRHGIPLRFTEPGTFEQRARRWAELPFEREELPARAFYAARGSGREADLDAALFRAAYVDLEDVNEEAVVRAAATAAGLDPDDLLARARGDDAGREVSRALADFDRLACPGVPTFVVAGERFWGKDRVEDLAERVLELEGGHTPR